MSGSMSRVKVCCCKFLSVSFMLEVASLPQGQTLGPSWEPPLGCGLELTVVLVALLVVGALLVAETLSTRSSSSRMMSCTLKINTKVWHCCTRNFQAFFVVPGWKLLVFSFPFPTRVVSCHSFAKEAWMHSKILLCDWLQKKKCRGGKQLLKV